jgi:hypothetical protein
MAAQFWQLCYRLIILSIRHQELIRRKQMTKPTRVEVNCTTGETSIIELTDAEVADMAVAAQAAADQQAAAEAEAAAVAAAKDSANAKLAALGLTAEEIAALSK